MLTLWLLHVACQLHGLDGRLCLAVGAVESGYSWRVDRVSSKGCRGLMQTCYSPAPVPRWALSITVGSAWAGAAAIRYHRDLRGAAWPRYYSCSTKGARLKRAGCVQYQRAVLGALRQMRRPTVGQPVT